MRSFGLLLIDVALVALATFVAFALRENFDLRADAIEAFWPFFVITLCVAVPVLLAFRFNRSMWRYSSVGDFVLVFAAVGIITVATVAAGFTFNRLNGIARSLPLIQAMVMVAALCGIRSLARARHLIRQQKQRANAMLPLASTAAPAPSILLVGVSEVTRVFLRSFPELNSTGATLAGIVGTHARHSGRKIGNHKVIGTVEDIDAIIRNLEVHGITVGRVILLSPKRKLSAAGIQALKALEDRPGMRVDVMEQFLGVPVSMNKATTIETATAAHVQTFSEFTLLPHTVETPTPMPAPMLNSNRGYWAIKRSVDVLGALTLLTLMSPLLCLFYIAVALELRASPIFWQQRPGRYGVPFRVYKFQTMGRPFNRYGERIPDAQRITWTGALLRATRFDEFPQLFNVLFGDMSLVGPRPLLPIDQPDDASVRLSVRPGLTGWAQIKGGRSLSIAHKAARDAWYVENASLWVDFKILAGTLRTVVLGDRHDLDATEEDPVSCRH